MHLCASLGRYLCFLFAEKLPWQQKVGTRYRDTHALRIRQQMKVVFTGLSVKFLDFNINFNPVKTSGNRITHVIQLGH